jgi:hypothetical protein
VDTISTIAWERSASSRTRLKDFWDLTKPRMNMVVVMTTVAGYYLAAPGPVEWVRLVPTLVGTALAAAGASVLNQVMEREYDALMQRTASRPLPAGRIRPHVGPTALNAIAALHPFPARHRAAYGSDGILPDLHRRPGHQPSGGLARRKQLPHDRLVRCIPGTSVLRQTYFAEGGPIAFAIRCVLAACFCTSTSE